MLVRGGGAMEKRQQRGLLRFLAFCWPFAHMFFLRIP
jgi:hypothetical protein